MEHRERAGDSERLRRAAGWLLDGVIGPGEFITAAAFAASSHARSVGELGRPSLYLDLLNASDQWDESTPEEKDALAPYLSALAARVLDEVAAADQK